MGNIGNAMNSKFMDSLDAEVDRQQAAFVEADTQAAQLTDNPEIDVGKLETSKNVSSQAIKAFIEAKMEQGQ